LKPAFVVKLYPRRHSAALCLIIIIIIIITDVEPEMYDYTSNNWSHWNSNEKLKEKFGSCTRKTFDKSLQKTAILGTSHIIRKVLQCEA